ncbi:ROK family transcriptional regulator [Halobacillus karajensis]|uniref:N-acetylglucosamine repressor n=1 Tax=Halobacillus karajensis TaxID=195088 RepID=A0A024P2T4_9BACI|nr:ROK family transcriptional regulator [Halobacillus karajensis]CDQ19113.1 N-acetylglucosamine repressor [Halobacillus karajensis]CDQ22813.1 N-acetylglucosamine repressor [Halobacillus karajensis]CDQ26295.1 N-acetylglucosamine repressor [Halobacillus karajensis]
MSWSQQSIKSQNKKRILETIMNDAPVSRTAIAKKLGITKGTVSSLTTELMEEEIIIEHGPGSSSGGRRPLMLLFNEKAGYSIGINLGVNYIIGVLTNLNGEIIAEQRQSISKEDFKQWLPVITETIQSLINQAPASPYGVVGIGIGVPGMVDKNGLILLAPNLKWQNVHLKQELEQLFNLPVTIDNEANAGAYQEKNHHSTPADANNIVYVSAGIGIGVGLIIDEELYSGNKGFSGELGHMMIDINGRQCSCGSQGCWEMYASEKALVLEAERQTNSTVDNHLEALIEEAYRNDRVAALFTDIGYYLGIGISNILHTFNPEKVVIGNRLAMAKDLLQPSVKEAVERHSLSFHKTDVEISFSQAPQYSTALGSCHYMIEKFIENSY